MFVLTRRAAAVASVLVVTAAVTGTRALTSWAALVLFAYLGAVATFLATRRLPGRAPSAGRRRPAR